MKRSSESKIEKIVLLVAALVAVFAASAVKAQQIQSHSAAQSSVQSAQSEQSAQEAQSQPLQAIVTKVADTAINLPTFNSGAPFLSADELTIVFTSNRQDAQGIKSSGKDKVYTAHRTTVYQPFAGVRPLSRLLNRDVDYGILGQSIDGSKYFVYNGGDNNIYVLEGVLEGKQKLTDIGKYYGIKLNVRYDIYSCAISADEKTFYICQALPNGKGGADIWVSKRGEKGKWSEFENLEKINTTRHEITVSLSVEGHESGTAGGREVLYFSTNGILADSSNADPALKTLGGYDIYRYDIESGNISHLPAPINTQHNDVYYSAVPSFPDHAYYSSERVSEKGTYDIYFVDYKTARDRAAAQQAEQDRLAREKRLAQEQAERERALAEAADAKRRADSIISATAAALQVASNREKELLAAQQQREKRLAEEAIKREAQMKAEQQEREKRLAQEAAQREAQLRAQQQERERAMAAEQAAREEEARAAARRREDSIARAAAKAVEDKYAAALAAKGYKDMDYITDPKAGDRIYLRNILFDKGKASLMVSSYYELDKVLEFLNRFPQMRIEVGGHTSSEGSLAINQKLSEARAKSVRDYFIQKGIANDRVEYRGYNFSMPVESETTEFGRTLNRRVEITVIK